MRRFVLAVVTATLAALITAPPAAARTAAPDPVRALQKQLKSERGVKLVEVSKSGFGSSTTRIRAKSGVQLSPSGPVATYTSMEPVDEEDAPVEMLAFPRGAYLGGEELAKLLPDGKTWVGLEAAKGITINPVVLASMQPIHVFDPAVLKATLKGERAKPVSGGYSYRGVVTYKELYEASKSFYAAQVEGLKPSDYAKRKVSYRLWTDEKGLIQRLQTQEAMGSGEHRYVATADTRFSDWGHPLVISPPAADEVFPYEDLQNLRVPLPDPLEDPLLKDGLLGLR
ncbi:hypothetical protein [Nonomuraea harbinensis]|uniref:Uncharacterized protein n=1 Tax=Nonomuraea harbinensis TaxID=1286938 RepID=A0ABW1CAZ2_9ACTN|nr:hypothetical protein [Nonomuraea harbinensis]